MASQYIKIKCWYNFIHFMNWKILTPACKKQDNHLKEKYRFVSIFSNISKMFGRFIHAQVNSYFQSILSNF